MRRHTYKRVYVCMLPPNTLNNEREAHWNIFTSKMLVQAHASNPSGIYLNHNCLKNSALRNLTCCRKPFNGLKLNTVRNKRPCWCMYSGMFSCGWEKYNHHVFQLNGVLEMGFWQMKNQGAILSASNGQSNSTLSMERKRRVVEHIYLLKAREDLSDEQEKDMLDYLYTSQYQMGGIVAISLGRISDRNTENYTHAVYMRFQKKEDLMKFYQNSFYLGILRDHVYPYCHGLIYVDYESEVEDDILPIFRKGEEFNYGVEFILLIAFFEIALGAPAEDALESLAQLTMEFPTLIVQATKGSNFNSSCKEYTHGVVIRFRSFEAFQIFTGSSEYKDIWRSKFRVITKKKLSVHFSVDPVGTGIM